jgi:hypothetical protein
MTGEAEKNEKVGIGSLIGQFRPFQTLSRFFHVLFAGTKEHAETVPDILTFRHPSEIPNQLFY